MIHKKKLIEVALPLDAINKACAYEKMPGIGPHPRGLHLWWARRPLAAARAVIFAQLVDDPSAHPDLFPTKKKQEKERQRLFKIIEELVKWENSGNQSVINEARAEIDRSCDGKLPSILDPFCGGGTIPLEAQRLGLPAHGNDLNPVAVLITKALVEIPPRFSPVALWADHGLQFPFHELCADVEPLFGPWMVGYQRRKMRQGQETLNGHVRVPLMHTAAAAGHVRLGCRMGTGREHGPHLVAQNRIEILVG